MEVASARNSPGIIVGHQTARRKFFQWAVKWFYANMAEDTLERPDAPVLVCLLQSIGFQLREFEKIDEPDRTEKSKPNKATVRVTIECGNSGMRACLELSEVKCKCPNLEDPNDASFWSVSGTGRTAMAKVEGTNAIVESGSNLIPQVSKEISTILHDVTYRLLNTITEKSSDVSKNSSARSSMNISTFIDTKDPSVHVQAEKLKNISAGMPRSYTQPEILLPNAIKSRQNRALRKFDQIFGNNDRDGKKWWTDLENETIDGDQPRPSPPKISSSPVIINQLCSSLGQISLQSEEDIGNVAEHVVRAKKNLDKALEILMAKKSPSSRDSSIQVEEQATFLKPASGGLNVTLGGSRRLSSCSSNGSLQSSTGATRLRLNSSCSLPTREKSVISRVPRMRNESVIPKSSSAMLTRRSVCAPSMPTTAASEPTFKRQSSNVEQNSGASKIPGHRRSLSVLGNQPLKFAAASARGATIDMRKKSADPRATAANQTSSQQKIGSSIVNNNLPGGSLKFGYVKKKSSLL